MKEKIIRNAAKCSNCKKIIESKYRHDMVFCKCGKIAVDGGHDYLKRTGSPEFFEDLSVVICE